MYKNLLIAHSKLGMEYCNLDILLGSINLPCKALEYIYYFVE